MVNTAETLILYMNKTKATIQSYLTVSYAYKSALLFSRISLFQWLEFPGSIAGSRVNLNVISLKESFYVFNWTLIRRTSLYRSDHCERQQGARVSYPSAASITPPSPGLCTSFIGTTHSHTFAASPQWVRWNLVRSLLLREIQPQCFCGWISDYSRWHLGSTEKKISNVED